VLTFDEGGTPENQEKNLGGMRKNNTSNKLSACTYDQSWDQTQVTAVKHHCSKR